MNKLFVRSRYLIIIPVFGLIIAASFYFIFGGISLLYIVGESLLDALGVIEATTGHDSLPLAIRLVEYVHQLLIGTVLYITAVGLYQLFIRPLAMPAWLRVENTDELEAALVGVTVVVIGVHFMTRLYVKENVDLVAEGVASAAVIAALGVFLGLRAWSERQLSLKETDRDHPDADHHPH